VEGVDASGLQARETRLLARVGTDWSPIGTIVQMQLEHATLDRLIGRGLVQIGAVTPSDASHVLNLHSGWDSDAARLGLALLGRLRTGSGDVLGRDPENVAQQVIKALHRQSEEALLRVAFDADGVEPDFAAHALVRMGLSSHRCVAALSAGLAVPVIGLGASAHSYYPTLSDRLKTQVVVPQHAHVANAVGAVVGRVVVRQVSQFTSPSDGLFRAHLPSGLMDFRDLETARTEVEALLRTAVEDASREAGIHDVTLDVRFEVQEAEIDGRKVFIEAGLTVEGSGRPGISEPALTQS
jgi:N-methylhydantoinase A/oxoprolinase/acetone carboxylase beta subunit